MKKLKQISPNQFLIILLILWTILNIIQATYTEISGDEAYYWVISKSLSWGYYDHPPFFAWLVHPSVILFGDTELGVRLFSVLCQPIYLYLFWTLVRDFRPTGKGALVYFAIAFSIPLLQLYGWVVTPDTPLMLATAIFLWVYRRFLDSQHNWNVNSIVDTIILGLSIALLGYAKYNAALIVALVVLSNFRILAQPKVYIAGAIAAIAYIPHIIWQADNDWVSFMYHLSGRVTGFSFGSVIEYVLNTISTFNPFLIPLFFIFAWPKNRKSVNNQERFENALSYITWGFLLFFLYSTRNVHSQPQWLIPLCFPMLYFIFKASASRVKLTNYIIKVAAVMAVLLIATRIFAIAYSGDLINFDIFNSEKQYKELAEKIDNRPLITNGTYMVASKIRFYTSNNSYAKPNLYNRSSHYQFIDNESQLYHKPIAIEISDSAWVKTPEKVRKERYIQHKVWHYNLNLDTISNFVPVRNVKIDCVMPSKTITGQSLATELNITNPYQWDIPLTGDGAYEIFLIFKGEKFRWFQTKIKIKNKIIPSYAKLKIPITISIPTYIPTNSYKIGFALIRYPYTPWFNSSQTNMLIVNPTQNH